MFLESKYYSFICIVEHWLTNDQISLVKLPGYKIVSSFCRNVKRHGGVVMYVRECFMGHCRRVDLDKYSQEVTAEFCGVEISKTVIITVYRSGNGDVHEFLNLLEILLNDLTNKYEKIAIVGDFNINFSVPCSSLEDLICTLSLFNIEPRINSFTRVSGNTRTCIDNILTNFEYDNFNTCIFDPCMSDHYCITFELLVVQNERRVYEFRRIISDRGIGMLCDVLNDIDWTTFYCSDSGPWLASFLTDTFKALVNNSFPLKKILIGPQRAPVSWFNEELRTMRNTLNALKVVVDFFNDDSSLRAYKHYKKNYRETIVETKRASYTNFIQNSHNKSKDCWRLINFESNKNKNTDVCPIDPEKLNYFFATVAESLIGELPDNVLEDTYSVPHCIHSFFLTPVTYLDVADAIDCLKDSAATDVYGLNSKLVKGSKQFLVFPLTFLFNKCIEQGVFPDSFKTSKIIPIFKKGDKLDPTNYRPISIIPIFGKIFEKLLKTKLIHYLGKNNIINGCQFGFRAGYSTTQAVSALVESIVEGFEGGRSTGITLCDLSKAFDCVDHDKLLRKMEFFYGFRGISLEFFRSYLSNRTQCIQQAGEVVSDLRTIKYGVPQGSVLGPILFILYINDLCKYLSPQQCILYADDTSLIVSAADPAVLCFDMTGLELRAKAWFDANSLCMNTEKTQRIIVSSNPRLNGGESVKLLGITIDEGLTWHTHIDLLSRKLSSSIYLLRRLRKFIDITCLLNTYYAFVYSHISYGITLWGSSGHAERVFRLQKGAIRVLAGVGLRDHCRPYFIKFGILTVPCIFILHTLLEIHKKKNVFKKNSHFHTYNTRNADHLRPPRLRLQKCVKNSLSLELYNKLSTQTKNLPAKRFGITVKTFLTQHAFYSVNEYMTTSLNV